MTKKQKTEALREGQFVIRTIGERPKYVNRALLCANPNDYLSHSIAFAMVYSSLDNREYKVRFWSSILKQAVEAVDVPMVNGVAVGDTVMVEDLETGRLMKTKADFIDPSKEQVSVVVGKSMRILLHNNRTNGRYYCPQMSADAQQAQQYK